ncbi:MAG: hypothetical protein JXA69_06280 [Phycisphaerae bacterium]|nr:hypothetical protein [Phycisphaerae bacterium]
MRRIFQVISLLAVMQLLGLAGLTGYLFASGKLTPERIDRIAEALRDQEAEEVVVTTQPAAEEAEPETATSQIARSWAQQELFGVIAERQKRELEDRLRVNQRLRWEVERKLEEIEERERRFQEARNKLEEQQMQSGFERELELLSTMEPKRARQLLMNGKEVDAVRLVMEMDAGRAKKILDTCKTTTEMEWARRILDRIHNLSNDRADAEAIGSSQEESTGG